jgi:DNA-dependent RNA polymerase auxiliary subunit epsilon
MNLRPALRRAQRGLSMIGFLFVLVILALVAVLGMKIVPTVSEYFSIKKAITTAAASGTSVRDIQMSFDKQRDVNYIESVSGKDLEIMKTADGFEVTVAYQKKIPLVGPASLVLDYVVSNVSKPTVKQGDAK